MSAIPKASGNQNSVDAFQNPRAVAFDVLGFDVIDLNIGQGL
mgnify:CR=1 FL=1